MKSRSAKNKGREGQNEILNMYKRLLHAYLEPGDISGAIMGESGVDIRKSPRALKFLPWYDEVKRCQRIEIIKWLRHTAVRGNLPPVVHFRQNKPRGNNAKEGYSGLGTWYTAIPTAFFMELVGALNGIKKANS